MEQITGRNLPTGFEPLDRRQRGLKANDPLQFELRRRSFSGCRVLRVLALPLFILYGMAMGQEKSGTEIVLDASMDNLQGIINSASEHTVFIFKAGVYRGLSLTAKGGDSFIGLPGAILNGSEVVTFKQVNARLWQANPPSARPEVIRDGTPCEPGLKNADGTPYTVGCTHSRSLYWDDRPLWRVASLGEVAPQKWFFDETSKTIYIGENPMGHTVELGEMPIAISGSGPDVRIEGLRVEKYAGSRSPAIQCLGGNWKIRNNVVRWNHSDGIGFIHCDGIEVSGNVASFNGDLGLGGSESNNALVESNEFNGNNYAHFDRDWEAGGAKWALVQNLTVRYNRASDNLGFGLWIDVDSSGVVFEGNIAMNNERGGIFYEISREGTIQNNIAALNGYGAFCEKPWMYCGQITISTSSNVNVRGNVAIVGEHGNGITVLDQERGAGKLGLHVSRDNTVSGNSITYLTKQGMSGAASGRDKVFQNNNIFDGNTYYLAEGTEADPHFVFQLGTGWEGFQKVGFEKRGHITQASNK